MKIEKLSILAVIILCVLLIVVACGSGDEDETTIADSGLAADLYLDEFSTDEKQTFCTWYVDLFGGEGKQYTCSVEAEQGQIENGEESVEIPSVEECKQGVQLKSHCTMGVAEACFKASAGDPCAMSDKAECVTLNNCLADVANPPDNACDDDVVKCFCTYEECTTLFTSEEDAEPQGTTGVKQCRSWFICSEQHCDGYQPEDKNQACKDAGLCEACEGGICGCAF